MQLDSHFIVTSWTPRCSSNQDNEPKDKDNGPRYQFVKVNSNKKIDGLPEGNNIKSKARTITAY